MVVPILITISISNFSEKARWALDYCHIKYVEEVHVPGGHTSATKKIKGGKTVPALDLGGGKGLTDSTPIVIWADENAAPTSRAATAKLVPSDPAQREAALELAALFGDKLGVAARAISGHHIANEPSLAINYIMEGPGGCERCLFCCCKPVLKCVLPGALRVTPQKEAEHLATLDEIFELVGKKIQGRKYLIGETFGVADLCFASLAIPILYPDELVLSKRQFAEKKFPPALRDLVNKYRNTPAGQYALRLYKEDRYVPRNN